MHHIGCTVSYISIFATIRSQQVDRDVAMLSFVGEPSGLNSQLVFREQIQEIKPDSGVTVLFSPTSSP